jgi:predicted MFS family arabinose efflux permease
VVIEMLERTPPLGWAVILLFRAQQSSVILVSYTFGLFLPFIREDLGITPLQAGLLQGAWWITAASLSLPSGAWFSRFRPVPLVLVSLLLGAPFLFVQALAPGFWVLLLGRFCFILSHTINTPARALLLRQWCAPHQYALVQSFGLSQHSVILALAVSLSPWVIEGLGSWRIAYAALGVFFTAQIAVWLLVAREKHAPPQPPSSSDDEEEHSPWLALRRFPQGWLIAVVMLFLSSTWTGMVTFLPTLWVEERDVALTLGGPLLGFLYYALIPSGFLGGWLLTKLRSRKMLLVVPALLNAVFGVVITLSEAPPLLMVFITGLGLVWVATPAIQVLPFEFPGVLPREVAVLTGLILTFMGVGFALGPMLVGVVAQLTGSIQTGLIALSLLTVLGVVAGLVYPDKPGTLLRWRAATPQVWE